MTVTSEELAAYADGELNEARAAEVAAAVAADPTLEAEVARHRALRAQLATHFGVILEQPIPQRLAALLRPQADIIEIGAARERHIRHWGWIAAPALAASLALAVFLAPGGGEYAPGDLAQTLETQLAASQAANAQTRILLSFQDGSGSFCRAFAGATQSGVACRDDEGWRLVMKAPGMPQQSGDYRMAGSPAHQVLERAQALANGPALDAAQEQAAKARGWR